MSNNNEIIELKGTPSVSNSLSLAFVFGSASLLAPCKRITENNIIPSLNYEVVQNFDYDSLPKLYEFMNTASQRKLTDVSEINRLIEMPVVNRISIRFNKPKPLVFTSVENNEGFIE